MYAIAPGAGFANAPPVYSRRVRASISAGYAPARIHSARLSMTGSTVRAAGGLKQCGARTRGFQKPGSFTLPENERSTTHVKPLVPRAASTKPVRVITSTAAESETSGGAAVLASATSAARSAIR